jgi:hypothetical protein
MPETTGTAEAVKATEATGTTGMAKAAEATETTGIPEAIGMAKAAEATEATEATVVGPRVHAVKACHGLQSRPGLLVQATLDLS